MNFNAKSKLQSTSHLKIIASYWFLFAYWIGAALIVRLFTPALPAVVWLSFSGVILASILISWGAETAQFLVSQGLAIAFITLSGAGIHGRSHGGVARRIGSAPHR